MDYKERKDRDEARKKARAEKKRPACAECRFSGPGVRMVGRWIGPPKRVEAGRDKRGVMTFSFLPGDVKEKVFLCSHCRLEWDNFLTTWERAA